MFALSLIAVMRFDRAVLHEHHDFLDIILGASRLGSYCICKQTVRSKLLHRTSRTWAAKAYDKAGILIVR
jgi:hypothetical protein